MTDTAQPAAPPPPEPGHAIEEKHRRRGLGFLIALAKRIRDSDNTAFNEMYLRWGISSCRIYALIIFFGVPALAILRENGVIIDTVMLWITVVWCVFSTIIYLWFQGKLIVVPDVVSPEHANRDVLNSFWPGVAIAVDFVIWLVLLGLYVIGWATVRLHYDAFIWFIMLTAFVVTLYDLKINNKIALKLAQAYPRFRETEEQGRSR